VSLTTFRRSGDPVATTVWVVASHDGREVVAMTPAGSGKVKRLRNDPTVQLRPSGRFGKVADDAPVSTGTARLAPYDAELEAAFKAKYGLEYRLVMGAERRFSSGGNDRVAVRITLSPA
jgi:uncharacterized protein